MFACGGMYRTVETFSFDDFLSIARSLLYDNFTVTLELRNFESGHRCNAPFLRFVDLSFSQAP